MKVTVYNTVRDVTPLVKGGHPVEGGEGGLYPLDGSRVLKIYHPEHRIDARRRKVVALTRLYWRYISEFGHDNYAFPESPVFEGTTTTLESIVGYSMAYFNDCPSLDDLRFDLTSGKFAEPFSDTDAIQLVYGVFELVAHLHKGDIILGDVNGGNIMCNRAKRCPVIIDLDSAQIGFHPCTAKTPTYLDPLIESQGTVAGGALYFSTGSDIFALAYVAFEFLVGVGPFGLRVDPPMTKDEAKRAGVSNVGCYFRGEDFLTKKKVSLAKAPSSVALNNSILSRINALYKLDKNLMDFFYRTFVEGQRESVLNTLPKTDPRHTSNIFCLPAGVRLILKKAADAKAAARTAAMEKLGRRKAAIAPFVRNAMPTHAFRDPPEFSRFLSLFGIVVASSHPAPPPTFP